MTANNWSMGSTNVMVLSLKSVKSIILSPFFSASCHPFEMSLNVIVNAWPIIRNILQLTLLIASVFSCLLCLRKLRLETRRSVTVSY